MNSNFTTDQTDAAVHGGRVIRILLVWWVRFTGESLAEMIERDSSVSVVGLCTDPSEAAALSASLHTDLVLLDARIPNGTTELRRALDIAPGMRVVVSAIRETEEDVIAWAEAGAIGYIPGSTPLSDIVRLIVEIHRGKQMCSGSVAAGLLRRIGQIPRSTSGWVGQLALPILTARERQTAELIKIGLSDKEIARRLNISVATTKWHIRNLLGKLRLRRRRQVADYLRHIGSSEKTLHSPPRSLQ